MKHLLLISYYFPPSGGPGVQRTLKFVKYLPEFGWHPTVLTVEPESAAYPAIDRSLESEVPAGVTVVRTRSWDPYGLYASLTGKARSDTVSVSFAGEAQPNRRQRFGRWLRGNVFLPDARVGWVPFGRREARRLIGSGSFDAIMTTGPPHSSHLIGLPLAGSSGLPWLADFRDPWTGIDFSHLLPSSALAQRVDSRLERRVLSGADRVTIVSPSLVDHLQSRHPRPYDVIMNGFDDQDFVRAKVGGGNAFSLSYLGSMDASRNPEALWEALSRDTFRDTAMKVRLIGRVDPIVRESVAQHGLEGKVDILDQVEHTEVVRWMGESSLLLVVINRTPLAAGIVPGKTYEYIGSGRPILGLGPTDGDAARVVADSGAGSVFDHDDVEGVARYLARHVEAWSAGRPVAGASEEQASAFTRRNRTQQLAGVLDSMVSEVRDR